MLQATIGWSARAVSARLPRAHSSTQVKCSPWWIDYDFTRFDEAGRSMRVPVLRGKIFDHRVAGFLSDHPGGTVVELGAGLNPRFDRLDNGHCHWGDLDLPDSMEVRRRFFAPTRGTSSSPDRCSRPTGSRPSANTPHRS